MIKQQLQKGSKAKDIKYNNLEIQEYLISAKLNDDEKQLMTALRTKCVKGIRRNFPGMHRVCQHCPLNCMIQEPQEDTQDHVLNCKSIGAQSNVPMEFMCAGTVEQSLLARLQSTGLQSTGMARSHLFCTEVQPSGVQWTGVGVRIQVRSLRSNTEI